MAEPAGRWNPAGPDGHLAPGPAFTLDDLIAFHFLLMDETSIEEFLEGEPS